MIRLPVAFDFSKQFERDYDKAIHITSDIILKINYILNFFRNVCAHDEILYNFKVYKFFKDEPIFINTFNNYNFTYKNDGSLFNAIAYLQLVTPKEIFNNIQFTDGMELLSVCIYNSIFNSDLKLDAEINYNGY